MCHSTTRAMLAPAMLAILTTMLAGCATVSYKDSNGVPVAIKAVGYDFTVPTVPPLTFTVNPNVSHDVASTVQSGGETVINHFADKAAEAQGKQ